MKGAANGLNPDEDPDENRRAGLSILGERIAVALEQAPHAVKPCREIRITPSTIATSFLS